MSLLGERRGSPVAGGRIEAALESSVARRWGPPLQAAVEAYSRTRRPRTTSVVRQTRRMSAVVQARGRLALRARDAALSHMRPRILGAPAPDWIPPD